MSLTILTGEVWSDNDYELPTDDQQLLSTAEFWIISLCLVLPVGTSIIFH